MTQKKSAATSSASSAQYSSPKWQKKRLEILERDGFTCCRCGDNESTLHVHHLIYKKGVKLWEYSDHLLSTLCSSCHEELHSIQRMIDMEMIEFSRNWANNRLIGTDKILRLLTLFNVSCGEMDLFTFDAAMNVSRSLVDLSDHMNKKHNLEEAE